METGKPDEGLLKRKVGLFGATMSGIGIIVGAGIYVLIGEAVGLAGGIAWLSFLIAATVAAFTASSYVRMGRRVPKDSPEFQYAKTGLGQRAGFTAGWLMLWAGLISTAAVALGFGSYLEAFTGFPMVLSALILVAMLSVVVWIGVQQSISFVVVMALVEVLGLLAVIAVGIPHIGDHTLLEAPKGVSGIWAASALVFFAYIGFEALGNLAEEMRNPQKDLPKAIIWAVVVSTILYVLVAISAVSLIGWRALADSSAPMASAVEIVLGDRGKLILGLVALASTSNTVLLLLFSVSRSVYGMAQAGALPKFLGTVGRRKTPWVSTLIIWAIASSFLFIGSVAGVARVTNFSTLISFALVNLSLFVVLRREGSKRSALRIALLSVVPMLGVLSCIWLASRTGWIAAAVGAGLALAGFALGQLMWQRGQRMKPGGVKP